MAGFFALRRSTFEAARGLEPLGFKILLELLVRARIECVREVPIQFARRKRGASKLSLRETISYLRHLARLYAFRFPGALRLARFLAVGASGMLVDLGAFFLLLRLLPLGLSVALAIWCAMSWNFFWNRRWTFADARPRPFLIQYVLFSGSCLLGAAINWSISVSLIQTVEFFREVKVAARLLGIAAGVASNYTLSALVVFRPEARTPRRAESVEEESRSGARSGAPRPPEPESRTPHGGRSAALGGGGEVRVEESRSPALPPASANDNADS